jgi:hypothetical protein
MPYQIVKVSPYQNIYKVINKDTGIVHSKHTTLLKAKAQIRLLHSKEHK